MNTSITPGIVNASKQKENDVLIPSTSKLNNEEWLNYNKYCKTDWFIFFPEQMWP